MATMREGWVMDWSDCDLVEVVPGKVSGAPLLVGTRIPAEAITVNYESSHSLTGHDVRSVNHMGWSGEKNG
jgi:uncharacterized protein (DUF433 family)